VVFYSSNRLRNRIIYNALPKEPYPLPKLLPKELYLLRR
jgi:hypothetical protein